MIPLFGVTWGGLFLGEPFTPGMAPGVVLAVVDLDAEHHLIGFGGVIGDQAVQLGKAGHPDPEAPAPEDRPLLIHHRHVVVGLGPVDAHEDHDAPPLGTDPLCSRA